MSDELRTMLIEAKKAIEAPNAAPVINLHDPDTGKMFGALVSEEFMVKAEELSDLLGWDIMDHEHIEGTEDDEWSVS